MRRLFATAVFLALFAAGCQSNHPGGNPYPDRQGCISPRAQSNGYCNR